MKSMIPLTTLALFTACQQAQAPHQQGMPEKKSEFRITPQNLAIMQAGARGQEKDLSELLLMQENPDAYRQYQTQKTLEEIRRDVKNMDCTSRVDRGGHVNTHCD